MLTDVRGLDVTSGTNVQFISYTGEWPNLCRGVLTLKIEDEIVKFGYDLASPRSEEVTMFDPFWSSGGCCGFTNDYCDSYIEHDEWEISVVELPARYTIYAQAIDDIFNENVDFGCCGGCL